MRFLFVVHKNEEKAEQNSVLFHRLTLKERGLRPNGYFPLMRQPLFYYAGNIACDISGITKKEACRFLSIHGRHARKGIYDFLLHTFVACEKALYARLLGYDSLFC